VKQWQNAQDIPSYPPTDRGGPGGLFLYGYRGKENPISLEISRKRREILVGMKLDYLKRERKKKGKEMTRSCLRAHS
jgi:hypothetical protein